jgi:hypothetical protein
MPGFMKRHTLILLYLLMLIKLSLSYQEGFFITFKLFRIL